MFKIVVLLATLAVTCSAIEQKLSFSQSFFVSVSQSYSEGFRSQLNLFDNSKVGLVKVSTCFGVSNISMRIKYDSKAVLTTSPLVAGDTFAFAVPPGSNGKYLTLEFQASGSSGSCFITIE